MKYRKFNKYEKKEVQAQVLANALHGEGLYLFQNNTNADLTLPRPTKSGLRIVGPKQQFQGDNYYMQLVKTGYVRLVKEIQSPAAQKAALTQTEVKVEEKLLLDQPDMITEQGKVEHVVNKNTPLQKLNEQKGKEKQPEVLLNEGPASDGFVVLQ